MTAYNTARMSALTEAIKKAEQAQVDYLRSIFPKGTRVKFKINDNQKVPSNGTVAAYHSGSDTPYIEVFHVEAKTHSRYRYRRVPLNMLTEP